MVTGALRLPHTGSLLSTGTGESLSDQAPPGCRESADEIVALSAVIDAVHQRHPCHEAEDEADDGSAFVHHRRNLVGLCSAGSLLRRMSKEGRTTGVVRPQRSGRTKHAALVSRGRVQQHREGRGDARAQGRVDAKYYAGVSPKTRRVESPVLTTLGARWREDARR